MSWNASCLCSTRSKHRTAAFCLLLLSAWAARPVGAQEVRGDTVPDPRGVWVKSAVVPGWGQAVNRQAWKIPLIYGALGGVALFSASQHRRYHDYRAAFYNAQPGNTDQRFGPTKPGLEGLPPEFLRYTRNTYRNRRDLSIIVFVAAWGLNIVDAYVFAHLRDFDVGPDLTIHPAPVSPFEGHSAPGFDLRLTVPINKRK